MNGPTRMRPCASTQGVFGARGVRLAQDGLYFKHESDGAGPPPMHSTDLRPRTQDQPGAPDAAPAAAPQTAPAEVPPSLDNGELQHSFSERAWSAVFPPATPTPELPTPPPAEVLVARSAPES